MEKEEWIDDIMGSLQGSSRARPDDALFRKIQQEVRGSEGRVIPINRIRMAAAAAAILLLVNMSALSGYTQSNIADNTDLAVDDTPYNILSDYKVYNQ